jgi:predicted  nucleic acid-binding Zn-ribbon protein
VQKEGENSMSNKNERTIGDRDALVADLKNKLDQANAKIDKLEARLQDVSANTRQQYEQEIDALKARRDAYQQRVLELQAASADAWSDLRSGLDEAWQNLADALEKAKTHFEKSPEPTG